jgi:hypothetical protein
MFTFWFLAIEPYGKSAPNTACSNCLGTLRILRHFAWLQADPDKIALSRLAHQRVSREDHTGQAADR